MSSRLDCITDWEKLAQKAQFRVGILADQCGVTERQLRRYFIKRFGQAPHSWITSKQLEKAKDTLLRGKKVKEAIAKSGISDQKHFAREFQKHFKIKPHALRNSENCGRQTIQKMSELGG